MSLVRVVSCRVESSRVEIGRDGVQFVRTSITSRAFSKAYCIRTWRMTSPLIDSESMVGWDVVFRRVWSRDLVSTVRGEAGLEKLINAEYTDPR